MLSLSATSKDNDDAVDESPKVLDEGQISQELLMKQLGMDDASKSSGFDAEMMPLPLFTSLLIFIGSTVLTLYGLYIGIVGFPVDIP